ncbi:unnamed protein product [Triticum turgidum subsp. durum]|uniref:UBA domain-containing protein n=1 Tax=Triticum turgidum subsp. durum TaxID=4567 RepID=A0A9R0TZR2_TRITD|nr:unnamed protein product [Triticum turgidum subsp. durum]
MFSWMQAGVSTRLNQWWGSTPFITSGVTIICAAIYLVCLLVGYDSYAEICFLPSAVASHFQVYRFYTSVLFHGSLLHVLFNMLTFVPLGTELERIMGSVRLLFLMFLLATTNAIFHLIVAFLVDYNPLYHVSYLVDECSIGFSGVIFSMIVIETSLSGVQYRSVFGLFNVPAKWYSFYAPVEFLASSLLCLIIQQYLYLCIVRHLWVVQLLAAWTIILLFYRRLVHARTTYGQLPTHSNMSTPPRHTAANAVRADATVTADQTDTFDEELKKLVAMGFERTQAEVALAAADGDPNVAIEILMSQQYTSTEHGSVKGSSSRHQLTDFITARVYTKT